MEKVIATAVPFKGIGRPLNTDGSEQPSVYSAATKRKILIPEWE